jgi:histidine triad (HIT) family protein
VVLDVAPEQESTASAEEKSCLFCAIARGEAPADIVLDDPAGVAFLDRRPLLPGHTLLVPRTHIATLRDLPFEQVGPFFALAQRLAAAVQEATGADGTFLAINNVVSQSVPHLHVHIVPRRHDDRLFSRNLAWTRHPYRDDAERVAIAEAIRQRVEEAGSHGGKR